MSDTTIKATNLTKFYGDKLGVQSLNFEVRRGEVFGYLGPNGAGKTTTLRLLVGLLNPTEGEARILGFSVRKDSPRILSRVGYIPGEVKLFNELTGRETINLFCSLRPGRPPVLLESLLDLFELDLSRKVGEYSSGNKQKLAVIQAFMHDPDVLILDEPTANLDPLMRHRFYSLVREVRDRGRTVVISSHVLPEMEDICDRVGIIRRGRLAAVESIENLAKKKIRRARFTLSRRPSPELLRFTSAEVVEEGANRYQARISGDMDTFVKELARLPVSDLEISHASLEEIFLQYYGEAGDGPH
jgi:ABC-2 type transport system ATP-binding protein